MDEAVGPSVSGRLLGEEKVVVTIGAAVFEESLRRQGAEVIVVQWQPPREVPNDVAALLKELL